MPEKSQQFIFQAYTPQKHRFKPLVDDNFITERPTANVSISLSKLGRQDDEYSEWNGISDAEDIPLSPVCEARSSLLDHDGELMSSPTQYFDAFEDQPNHEPEDLSDMDEEEEEVLAPSIDYDFNIPSHLTTTSAMVSTSANQEVVQMPPKRGRKVQSTFPLPPQGELAHPFEGWVIDKAAMDEYMPNYAKQEGCAVNPLREHGGVIRWRCIHGGKHNNHRSLPVEVTDKKHHENASEIG